MINLSELRYLFKSKYKGYGNRVSLDYLCDHFDQKDNREIRRAIHKLREKGFYIASTSGRAGYWYVNQDLIDSDVNEREHIKRMVRENGSRMARIEEMNKPFVNLLKYRKPADQIKIPFKNEAQAVTY